MGKYVNPGNESFVMAVKSEIYIDKTGIIKQLNKVLGTEQRCICMTRARRFGKSMTAGMLKAYYSKGCNSESLFAGLDIEKDEAYKEHLNAYDVLHIDMSSIWLNSGKKADRFIPFLNQILFGELKEEYPLADLGECETLSMALAQINHKLGIRFVIIIDEWDTIFREEKGNEELQDEYISVLRGLFKSEEARQFVALAYLTGILPIKKYGIESALNNFREYTMIDPVNYAQYYGFTSDEVEGLCKQYGMDFEKMQYWYDGYSFEGEWHIYNPNSVVNAMLDKRYKSYWANTEAFSSLQSYICLNFEGLKDDIIRMFSGGRCRVMVGSFANDLVSYKSKDDVLTALIHLGYLAYDFEMKEAFIPNAEVQEAFEYAINGGDWTEIADMLRASEELLKKTWAGEEEAVAQALDRVHGQTASILQYNDENSLSCAINLAYYYARIYYEVVRETPAGKGYADIVFLPKKKQNKPAMIVELKYNQSTQAALAQIREKQYSEGVREHKDNLLLVGINYDKTTKQHTCLIERYRETREN